MKYLVSDKVEIVLDGLHPMLIFMSEVYGTRQDSTNSQYRMFWRIAC